MIRNVVPKTQAAEFREAHKKAFGRDLAKEFNEGYPGTYCHVVCICSHCLLTSAVYCDQTWALAASPRCCLTRTGKSTWLVQSATVAIFWRAVF